MKLAKEKKEIDFIIKSEPWSEKDLADFREMMRKLKNRNKIKNQVKPSQINRTA